MIMRELSDCNLNILAMSCCLPPPHPEYNVENRHCMGGGGRRWAREVVFASLASGTDAKVPKAPKVQICFKTFVHDCSLLEPYWPSVVFVGPHCDWSVLP